MRAWVFLPLVLATASAWAAATVSPEVFRILQEAEQQLNQNHPAQALERLRGLKPKSGVEQALLEAYRAYAQLALGRYAEAAQAAQAALGHPDLPKDLHPKLYLVLGQAELSQERFAQAAQALENALAAGSDPQTLYLTAYAYYRLRRCERAVELGQRAIQTASKLPEDWQNLLLACYLETKRYGEAEAVLQRLLDRQPQDLKLWQQWIALQLARNQPQQALATMVLAWHAGRLDQAQLLDLARLHAHVGIPEKAARLIQTWRQQKLLSETLDTLRLEAQLWLAARERRQALPVLVRIAEQSHAGSDWLAATRLAAELASWQEAEHLAQKAIQAGADAGEAALWLGIAAYHLGRAEDAASALERARRTQRYAAYADYWLGCLERQRRCR